MPNSKDEMSLGRLVTFLVAKLHTSDVEFPFRNQEPWHQLFYNLKRQAPEQGRPCFLDELVFDWDGPYPRCEELSEFLNGMHITANVAGLNPRFTQFNVDDDDAAHWTEDLNELAPEMKSYVSRAADLAKTEFMR